MPRDPGCVPRRLRARVSAGWTAGPATGRTPDAAISADLRGDLTREVDLLLRKRAKPSSRWAPLRLPPSAPDTAIGRGAAGWLCAGSASDVAGAAPDAARRQRPRAPRGARAC